MAAEMVTRAEFEELRTAIPELVRQEVAKVLEETARAKRRSEPPKPRASEAFNRQNP